MKNLLQRGKQFFKENRNFSLGILGILFVALLSLLGQSRMFKSSLLEVSNPFDGTIYPVEYAPNYLTWKGSVKTDRYETIDSKDLVPVPDYFLALENGDSDEIKNAKLIYPVVYLGNYKNDHREDAGSHLAIDIRLPVGTPVRSIANGVVVKVDLISSGFGHHTCIRHNNVPSVEDESKTDSYVSCYNHMETISVQNGDFVFRGQKIGTSGNTGTSTTPHLHFQIDKASAPWYPYWPFSTADALKASLSFFDAVSSGLGRDKAKEFTIHPFQWIAKYENNETRSSSFVATTDDDIVQNTPKLAKFSLSAQESSFTEKTTLTITAYDQNGKVFTAYTPSTNFSLESSSSSAEFKKTLRFTNGKATLDISNERAETFDFTVSENSITNALTLVSLEETFHASADDEETPEEDTQEDIQEDTPEENPEETPELTQSLGKILFSGETSVLTGSSLSLELTFLDTENVPYTSFEESFSLTHTGSGNLSVNEVSASALNASGKITVQYTAPLKAESVTISCNDFSFSFDVVEKAEEVSQFGVSFEGEVEAGKEVILVVSAQDKNGNDLPNYFALGTVTLSFKEGSGTFSHNNLEPKDFVSGKARVTISDVVLGETVQIEAKNTPFIGLSPKKVVKEASAQEVFSDVSASHKNAKAILYLRDEEIIGGYPDGSFKPDNEVSRIEALKMLLLGLNKGLNPQKPVEFPDTDASQWYAPFIGRSLEIGMVKGYPDGSFKPANSVNRAEYYKILMGALGVDLPEVTEDPFTDVPKDAWFASPVQYAKENGITDAVTEFFPGGNVTRAEVAETLYRVIMLLK
jgi:hypothetical protein